MPYPDHQHLFAPRLSLPAMRHARHPLRIGPDDRATHRTHLRAGAGNTETERSTPSPPSIPPRILPEEATTRTSRSQDLVIETGYPVRSTTPSRCPSTPSSTWSTARTSSSRRRTATRAPRPWKSTSPRRDPRPRCPRQQRDPVRPDVYDRDVLQALTRGVATPPPPWATASSSFHHLRSRSPSRRSATSRCRVRSLGRVRGVQAALRCGFWIGRRPDATVRLGVRRRRHVGRREIPFGSSSAVDPDGNEVQMEDAGAS